MVTITGPKIKIVTSDISIRDELNEVCQSVGDQIDRIARLAEQDGADLECLEALLIRINGMMIETESILEQATQRSASTIAAWENWEKLACQAVNMGMEEHILLKYTPFPKDRHQKIDKCIARLRVKIQSKKERLAWEQGARCEPEPFNYEQWNLIEHG